MDSAAQALDWQAVLVLRLWSVEAALAHRLWSVEVPERRLSLAVVPVDWPVQTEAIRLGRARKGQQGLER